MSRVLLFGKMPSHGDFVARGFETQERDSLDEWFSNELAAARAQLGEEFEQRFDSAPPWRFAWDQDGWTAGAMASSVDSAGRRFPLLVARRGIEAVAVDGASEACEDAIYDAFANGWSVDELTVALADDPAVGEQSEAAREGWWTLGGEEFPPQSLGGRRPAGLMRAILGGTGRAAA